MEYGCFIVVFADFFLFLSWKSAILGPFNEFKICIHLNNCFSFFILLKQIFKFFFLLLSSF